MGTCVSVVYGSPSGFEKDKENGSHLQGHMGPWLKRSSVFANLTSASHCTVGEFRKGAPSNGNISSDMIVTLFGVSSSRTNSCRNFKSSTAGEELDCRLCFYYRRDVYVYLPFAI